MKVERSYYVRGIKVPTIEDYMRIRKMDTEFTEELVLEIFKKDVKEATSQEKIKKLWREAKPFTAREFIEKFQDNQEALMVCFSIAGAEDVLKTMDAKLISEQTITKKQKRTVVNAPKKSGSKPLSEKISSDLMKSEIVTYEDTYKLYRIDKSQLGVEKDVSILEAVCPSTDRHFFLFVDTENEQCQTAIGAVAWTLVDENKNHMTEQEYLAIEQES